MALDGARTRQSRRPLPEKAACAFEYDSVWTDRFVNSVLLLLISVLWAVGIVLIKEDLADSPPVMIGAIRAALASTTILLICLLMGREPATAFRRSGAMLLLGVVGIVGLWALAFLFESPTDIDPAAWAW